MFRRERGPGFRRWPRRGAIIGQPFAREIRSTYMARVQSPFLSSGVLDSDPTTNVSDVTISVHAKKLFEAHRGGMPWLKREAVYCMLARIRRSGLE